MFKIGFLRASLPRAALAPQRLAPPRLAVWSRGLVATASARQSADKPKTNTTPHRDDDPRRVVNDDPRVVDDPLTDIKELSSIRQFSDLPPSFGSNQHMPVDLELRRILQAIVHQFSAPVRYAFGYGSGVFSQGIKSTSSTAAKPQLDLILAVDHAQHWHDLNLKQNPSHYSSLATLGSGVVSQVQNLGAGVYFNPFVEINGVVVKYGVVEMNTLLKDLSEWDTLYLAGRLHKPVKIIRDHPRVRFINQANLIAVLRTSLLLLPEKFSETELYLTIAGISYLGDPRMTYGENPLKVSNIVHNQFSHFQRLYSPLVDLLPNVHRPTEETGQFSQDMDLIRRANMICRLPRAFKIKLYQKYLDFDDVEDPHYQEAITGQPNNGLSSVSTAFDQHIAQDPNLHQRLREVIRATVSPPASTQSLKGILTAGILKSVEYAQEKLKKYYLGKSIVKK